MVSHVCLPLFHSLSACSAMFGQPKVSRFNEKADVDQVLTACDEIDNFRHFYAKYGKSIVYGSAGINYR